MSKFLLNLLLQISKAFVNSKNPIFIQKEFSSEFGPPGPASPVLARSAPQAAARARSAHPGLRGLGVIAKSRLYFEFAQPGDDAFSLCYRQLGPTCQIHPLPRAGRPRSEIPRASPQLIASRLLAAIIATPIKAPYSPALIPLLESPLTPSPAINRVGRKFPAVTHRHFLPGAPPSPIKGEHHPRVTPHLSPLLFPSLHAYAMSSPSAAASRFCTTVARPLQRRPSSGEARAELPVLPSPFCAPAGELWRTGVAGGQAPVSAPPCPLSASASVHNGPSTPSRSTDTWTRSTDLSVGK
jgi:hypothetical protein